MSPRTAPVATPGPEGRRLSVRLAAVVIVAAVFAVYANSLRAPFVFDDVPGIVKNPTIRDLGNLGAVLSPPTNVGSSANSRPVVNLTLALNYAAGGLNPVGYRLVNILIHGLSALVLMGLVRRTCLRPILRDRFGTAAFPIGASTALLWALHPLQTETVSCVIQRTEGLVGLFYLLSFYGHVRTLEEAERGAGTASGSGRWSLLTVGACLLGVFSKEVMATAPLLLFLFDRTFGAGSFRDSWRRRRGLYLALAATWLPLAGLMLVGGRRGGTVGFGLGVGAGEYALTQCLAVVHYLRLAVWPYPLVMDYGTYLVSGLAEVWPQALLLLVLGGATVLALRWRPVAGFLGAWFFVILAPSSSVVPLVTQTMAEHRMYLPLAAVAAPVAAGLWLGLGRRAGIAVVGLAVIFGGFVVQRNRDYRSALSIWQDTVTKWPENPRARTNLAIELTEAGRTREALVQGEIAVSQAPEDASVHVNYGMALVQANRWDEARVEFAAAVRLDPDSADANYNLGTMLAREGRFSDAIGPLQHAVELDPENVGAQANLANVLAALGRLPEAIAGYERVLRLAPQTPEAHFNYANALFQIGRLSEAEAQYEAALRLRPDYPKATANLEQVRRMLPSGGR